jgi:hypothetical protein
MGLKGDLHEVATVWNQSSWRVKIYLALSAFLASGSIASLSDTVFRWKGFVSDALSFYQTHISDQLLWVLQFGFRHVPRGASDLLILSALYVSANLRVAYFSLPGSQTRSVARRAISTYIGSIIALLVGNYSAGRGLDGESALGLFIGGALCASVSYWRARGAVRILWFSYLLGPFIIVGLIAAFVSGWGRIA